MKNYIELPIIFKDKKHEHRVVLNIPKAYILENKGKNIKPTSFFSVDLSILLQEMAK